MTWEGIINLTDNSTVFLSVKDVEKQWKKQIFSREKATYVGITRSNENKSNFHVFYKNMNFGAR